MELNRNTEILIVGLGVIGGGYARALTRQGYRVSCITKEQKDIDYAAAHGIIHSGYTEPRPEVLAAAELVVLALYPHTAVEWMRENQNFLRPGTLVTDVTGVKARFIREMQAFLRTDIEFISAHPMAGRESSGVEYSNDEVFRGANYIVVPTDRNTREGIAVCRRLGELLGEKAEAPEPRDQPKDCVQMLSEMGVPARFAGYHYLLYGVELARRNPQYLNRLTTELYPLIAERFGKRAANVERGIRYAVDMAFSNNSRLTLADSLNVDECQVTQRLTNRAIITLLANAKRPE